MPRQKSPQPLSSGRGGGEMIVFRMEPSPSKKRPTSYHDAVRTRRRGRGRPVATGPVVPGSGLQQDEHVAEQELVDLGLAQARKDLGPVVPGSGLQQDEHVAEQEPVDLGLTQARKDSANEIMRSIVDMKAPSSTIRLYMSSIRQWKTYCDEKYDGDSSVNASRMLEYFTNVVFKRTVKKYISVDAGYHGVVGVAGQGLENGDAVVSIETDESEKEADDPDDLIDGGAGQEEEGTKSRSANVISNILEKTNVIQVAPTDRFGRKAIFVPLTAGSVDNIRKALIYLWRQQAARTASCPNPAPNPRDDLPLRNAFNSYEVGLVYDSATPGAVREGTCSVRDPYTEKLFIRMLSFLWREGPLPQEKGKRTYNGVSRFQYMRERLCLLARHHMLLRDEDIRNLNLSDTFNIQTMNPAAGSKLASGLVFCIMRGKTNKKGALLYATAFRHKNFLRCTVGAFAFYMLERFQIEHEPIPDFSNPSDWDDIKLLSGGGTPEERKANRKVALSGRIQIETTASVMRACEVYSTKVTHSGRHAGTSEAYRLGLSLSNIRHLGRWVMGQMENFYAPKNPVIGAFYMAHFNKTDEPYFIERDLVTPSLALQRLIFPWIESSFDKDYKNEPGKRKEWAKECDKEMEGVDPNEVTNDDIFWTTTATKKLSAKLSSSALIDRIGFLKLLVRMRRVILQDAVLFMTTTTTTTSGDHQDPLTNRLITSLPDIFDSAMFLEFKDKLLRAMERHKQKENVMHSTVQVDNRTIINGFNTFGKTLQGLPAEIRSEMQQEMSILRQELHTEFDAHRQHCNQRHMELFQESRTPAMSPEQNLIMMQQNFLQQVLQPQAQPWHPPRHQHSQQRDSQLQQDSQHQQHQQQMPSQQGPTQVLQAAQSSSLAGDEKFKGYVMLADNGQLTVCQAWDEYHGPIAAARRQDSSWPYTTARRRALQRRQQFIALIKANAEEDGHSTEAVETLRTFLDAMTMKYKNKTINTIREKLLKERKQKQKEMAGQGSS